jgi:hypothetical protein
MRKFAILAIVVMLMSMVASVNAGGGEVSDPLCAGSLPNYLTNGMQGEIFQRFSTLRPAPYAPGKVIYGPATFTVLGDPVCAGYGPLWWIPIRYDATGEEGWASESQVYSIFGRNQRWLIPVVLEESAG